MDSKIKFNKARKKLQLSFKEPLSFKTIEVNSGIKTEILIGNAIISVGFCKLSINIQKDYLDSMLDAISNYDYKLIEE